MRKIEDCHDERIKAARYKMRDSQSAYKAAIRERNELLVTLHKTEYRKIDTLVDLFGMGRDAVEKVIANAEPAKPVPFDFGF